MRFVTGNSMMAEMCMFCMCPMMRAQKSGSLCFTAV